VRVPPRGSLERALLELQVVLIRQVRPLVRWFDQRPLVLLALCVAVIALIAWLELTGQ
jgi:hypothetical protein